MCYCTARFFESLRAAQTSVKHFLLALLCCISCCIMEDNFKTSKKQINFMPTDCDLRFDFNHSTGKLKYTMQIPHLLLNIRVPSMSNPWNSVTDLHL